MIHNQRSNPFGSSAKCAPTTDHRLPTTKPLALNPHFPKGGPYELTFHFRQSRQREEQPVLPRDPRIFEKHPRREGVPFGAGPGDLHRRVHAGEILPRRRICRRDGVRLLAPGVSRLPGTSLAGGRRALAFGPADHHPPALRRAQRRSPSDFPRRVLSPFL